MNVAFADSLFYPIVRLSGLAGRLNRIRKLIDRNFTYLFCWAYSIRPGFITNPGRTTGNLLRLCFHSNLDSPLWLQRKVAAMGEDSPLVTKIIRQKFECRVDEESITIQLDRQTELTVPAFLTTKAVEL